MSYLEFLVQPFNLPFLVAALLGMAAVPVGRRLRRSGLGPAAGLMAAGVCGLTWNGAIHDLGLGSPAPRLPLVLAFSAVLGAASGWGAVRLRDRWFRPIRGVAVTEPGHEGTEAVLVSRRTGPAPGSGRAQWQDGSGILHVVRCHTSGPVLRFGRTVRLGAYDPVGRSYRVSAR